MAIARISTLKTVCAIELRVRIAELSKTNNILDVLDVAIRAEGLRQKAIANNVANIKTPGYRRVDVEFEQLFEKALESDGSVDLREIEPLLYQPENTPVKSNGNDVTLEIEVGEMVKNSLRHKVFVRVLNRKYRQMEAAINVK